jgi:glycerol-3-phosphate dehydrogenase
LPGGEFEPDEIQALTARLARSYPFLNPAHAARLIHAYGARAYRVLGAAKSVADLGRHFGATLSEAEVRYLIEQEWATTAEDVLWRRSKLGLRLTNEEAAAFDAWMRDFVALPPVSSTPAAPNPASRIL